MEAFVIIAFREGLEAFLVLGIVLAFLQRNQLSFIKKYAWGGFAGGVISSIILGVIFTVIVDGFESEELQYDISLGVLCIAILLLTYMIFWIQHNSDSAYMKKKIVISTNQKLITFLIVYTAILREGLETALFSLALIMGSEARIKESLLGLSIGFTISAVIVWALFKSSVKLPLKSFFRYSSYLILFIVAGLVSLLIKGMQSVEYLPIFTLPLYDSNFIISNDSIIGKILGVLTGYDAQPSLLQVIGWISYITLVLVYFKMRKSNV